MTPLTEGVLLQERHPELAVGETLHLQERLVVSPCQGRFQTKSHHSARSGQYVVEGEEIGTVFSSDSEHVPVRTAFAGWVMGYLVPDGCPVRESEPLLWLRR